MQSFVDCLYCFVLFDISVQQSTNQIKPPSRLFSRMTMVIGWGLINIGRLLFVLYTTAYWRSRYWQWVFFFPFLSTPNPQPQLLSANVRSQWEINNSTESDRLQIKVPAAIHVMHPTTSQLAQTETKSVPLIYRCINKTRVTRATGCATNLLLVGIGLFWLMYFDLHRYKAFMTWQ